jgi:tRNA1(Val) A37 N6-methylase TrmN6
MFKLKNGQEINIQHENSFDPNLTTKLIYEAASNFITEPNMDILEVGCGCGVISLAIATEFQSLSPSLCLSDLSEGAVLDAKLNFKNYNVVADIRKGSVLSPWISDQKKYDLIIDDISGVINKIAEISPWFTKAPYATGDTGVELLLEFLDKSSTLLKPNGSIIFPLLNLSRMDIGLKAAREKFEIIEVVSKEWPIPEELANVNGFIDLCQIYGIEVKRKFGSYIGTTAVFSGKVK